MRTRLDAVVQVRERSEARALREVAESERRAHAALEKAEALRQAARQDHRSAGDATTWEMLEAAHARALVDARKAQKDAESAQQQVAKLRVVYTTEHQRAEVVRRVADSRREELRKEAERVEDKNLDEVASMLWFRKAG